MDQRSMLTRVVEGLFVVAIAAGVGAYLDLRHQVSELEKKPIVDPPGFVFPVGTMLANRNPDAQPPDGWADCLDVGGRALLGTTDRAQAGMIVGQPVGDGSTLRTSYEVDGERRIEPPEYPEGADNGRGDNWVHRHEVPALKVRFFCKQ